MKDLFEVDVSPTTSRQSARSMNAEDSREASRLSVKKNLEEIYKDRIAMKEFLITSTESIDRLSEYLLKLEEHVNREGDVTNDTIRTYNRSYLRPSEGDLRYRPSPFPSPFRGGSFVGASSEDQYLQREYVTYEKHHLILKSSLASCISAIVDCFETRKIVYATQLKQMRDVSNSATRTAMQQERGDASLTIMKLREALQKKHLDETDTLGNQLRKSEVYYTLYTHDNTHYITLYHTITHYNTTHTITHYNTL